VLELVAAQLSADKLVTAAAAAAAAAAVNPGCHTLSSSWKHIAPLVTHLLPRH
jgi:hypothetical protein